MLEHLINKACVAGVLLDAPNFLAAARASLLVTNQPSCPAAHVCAKLFLYHFIVAWSPAKNAQDLFTDAANLALQSFQLNKNANNIIRDAVFYKILDVYVKL